MPILDTTQSSAEYTKFKDVAEHASVMLINAVNDVWQATDSEERRLLQERYLDFRGDPGCHAETRYVEKRIRSGVITAKDVTSRLHRAIPGFVSSQLDRPLTLDEWHAIAKNSWGLVYDRAALNIDSIPVEPDTSHPLHPVTRKPFMHTLNPAYHTYDEAAQTVRTSVGFDEWEYEGRVLRADEVPEVSIGCPITLLGPKPTQRTVNYMADLAYINDVPLLDPTSAPYFIC